MLHQINRKLLLNSSTTVLSSKTNTSSYIHQQILKLQLSKILNKTLINQFGTNLVS